MTKNDLIISPSVLLSLNISPNQYVFMLCIKDGLESILFQLSNSSFKLSDSEIQDLVDKGLLINNNRPNERYLKRFEVTSQVFELDMEVDNEFSDKFLALFPQRAGSRLLFAHNKDLNKMFSVFFKNYNYTKEEIIKGTELYLYNENKNDFGKYILNPINFIYKDGIGSTLAMYCELAKTEVTNNDNWNQKIL